MSTEPESVENNITQERAARRFHQINRHEQLIAKVDKQISATKEKLTMLKEQRDVYFGVILAAARDEGDLPLFDMD